MVVKAMDDDREAGGSGRYSTGGTVRGNEPIHLDHCYAKPWNWRQEMAHCKPIRVLFAEDSLPNNYSEEFIDMDQPPPVKKNPAVHNHDATENNFFESEHKLSLLLPMEENSMDWEETVRRDGWTPLQHRIFNKVVKLLTADYMARLASEKLDNEAVQKKIHIEGSSKKLRIILSSVSWDVKITQWLHLTLIEHLSRDYLLCYISILQVLRSRVPTLVDRILNTPLTNSKLSSLNNHIVNFVVSKPWEPALNTVPASSSKLPVTPFIIMVSSGTNNYNSSSSLSGSRRFQTWHNLLQTLGRVMTISQHSITSPHTLPLPVYVESLISATIHRVQEIKAACPGRPIILAGLQQGALLAAQVAYLEPVTALICLGFPLFCVDGKRGEPDDFILDIRSPTQFIVGKSSTTCSVDGIEQLRHRMKAESSLVVVDGAVDSLRMLKWKKKQQNITQSMVDSYLLEEVSTFLTAVLAQNQGSSTGRKSPVERKQDPAAAALAKRLRSLDADDSPHPALSGHNYSQNTPFVQPWKGRGGTGLSRVRGGRVGPSQTRAPYQRTNSEAMPSTSRGRIARSISVGARLLTSTGEHLQSRLALHQSLSTSRLGSPSQFDGEIDSKSIGGSSQGSPKDDGLHLKECKGGGDSSETESAPPADEEDELMEDLRFCREFKHKQQRQTSAKFEIDSPTEDEFNPKYSGDEADLLPLADVCRRLSAENRNRLKKE